MSIGHILTQSFSTKIWTRMYWKVWIKHTFNMKYYKMLVHIVCFPVKYEVCRTHRHPEHLYIAKIRYNKSSHAHVTSTANGASYKMSIVMLLEEPVLLTLLFSRSIHTAPSCANSSVHLNLKNKSAICQYNTKLTFSRYNNSNNIRNPTIWGGLDDWNQREEMERSYKPIFRDWGFSL